MQATKPLLLALVLLSTGCDFGVLDEFDPGSSSLAPTEVPMGQGPVVAQGSVESKAPETIGTAPVPAAAALIPPTELLATKVGEYSNHCLNTFSARAVSSEQRYLSWVNASTGPTGRERHIYGLYTVSDNVDGCREAVARARSMGPSLPEMEAAAEAYITAIATLEPLLVTTERYYDRQSYRDDGMAEGRQLHPQLMAAFAAFHAADTPLGGLVQDAQDQVREARLIRLAGDPSQRSHYLIERTLDQSIAVFRMVEALTIDDRRYVAQDRAGLESKVQALQAAVDELTAWRSQAADVSSYGRFVSAAEEVLTSALGVMRRVRDGARFSRTELNRVGGSAEWMTDGSQGELKRNHNNLIRAYNWMR